jgi:hypothetical protein
MHMRVSLSSATLLLTGCAGPLGPPFGLGPEADGAFGLLMILLIGSLLYRSARGWQTWTHPEAAAIHILQERYARGELTREQFQSMMRDVSAL